MIRKGDSPNKGKRINKFISSIGHEGLRGTLLALNEGKTEGIIMCWNNSLDKQCKWGKMYFVKETNPKQYPEVVRKVNSIPKDFTAIF